MVKRNAAENPRDASVDISDANIDEHVAYIRKVEWEFVDTVDELLETFKMSHLRVRSA